LLHIEAKVFEFCSTESLKIGFPEAQGTSLVSAIGGRDLCLVFATATGHPGEVFFLSPTWVLFRLRKEERHRDFSRHQLKFEWI
jgi:hypothetical protein